MSELVTPISVHLPTETGIGRNRKVNFM